MLSLAEVAEDAEKIKNKKSYSTVVAAKVDHMMRTRTGTRNGSVYNTLSLT
jgi:hypothetical protein